MHCRTASLVVKPPLRSRGVWQSAFRGDGVYLPGQVQLGECRITRHHSGIPP